MVSKRATEAEFSHLFDGRFICEVEQRFYVAISRMQGAPRERGVHGIRRVSYLNCLVVYCCLRVHNGSMLRLAGYWVLHANEEATGYGVSLIPPS